MNGTYYELTINPTARRELFFDFLTDTLPIGFEETENGFIVRSEEDLETIKWGVEQFVDALQNALGFDAVDADITLERKQNDDWIKSYQESVTPVDVPPFYAHPTWEEDKADRLNIVIDPALAFGTGHHPTTESCLDVIGRYVKETSEVVDIGTGSGILAIAAAKMGAVVDACDTDPVSIDNALGNCKLNDLTLRHVWEGSAATATQTYDVVVANIVADVLVFIRGDLKKLLRDGAILILSGILDKYEAKILDAYGDMEMVERLPNDEWVTLVLKQKEF